MLHRRLRSVALVFASLFYYRLDATELPQPGWKASIIAGFNSVIAAQDSLLADNRGAEFGAWVVTPWRLGNAKLTALSLRAQTISFSRAIEIPSPVAASETIKLTNAAHSQLRADLRQVYEFSGISWVIGVGLMLPIASSIATPRGEFSYAETKNLYPDASAALRKMDRSYALYLRLGIDQYLLDDILLFGIGLDISALEFPRTEQLVSLNFYAGVRVW